MPLPDFNEAGDLPEGIHHASITEVTERFGTGSPQRQEVTGRLRRVYDLAAATGGLERLIIFGSYVTANPAPNDVDVILVMRDDFRLAGCPAEALALFDHDRAHREIGASIFWIRPGMLLKEPIDRFVAHWQIKRGGDKRGIVEVRP